MLSRYCFVMCVHVAALFLYIMHGSNKFGSKFNSFRSRCKNEDITIIMLSINQMAVIFCEIHNVQYAAEVSDDVLLLAN